MLERGKGMDTFTALGEEKLKRSNSKGETQESIIALEDGNLLLTEYLLSLPAVLA